MNVRELIAELSELPLDAPVQMHWDGAARTQVEAVWLTQGGAVSVGWLDEPVYDDEDRIAGAPPQSEDRYLRVHEMLGLPEPTYED